MLKITEQILNGMDVRTALMDDFVSDIVARKEKGGNLFYPNEKTVKTVIEKIFNETVLGNIFEVESSKEEENGNCYFRKILISPKGGSSKLEALGNPKFAQAIVSILANVLMEKLDLGNNVDIRIVNKTSVQIMYSII